MSVVKLKQFAQDYTVVHIQILTQGRVVTNPVLNNIPQAGLLPTWQRADIIGLLMHRQCAGRKKGQTYKMFKCLDE